MAGRFQGRVVMVTGASSPIGIGAAAAQRFAAEGATVALVARGARGLESVAKAIEERGGRAVPFPADLGDLGACEAVVQRALETLGGLDVLVNNAAANARGPVESRTPEELARIVQVNLIAPIVMTRLALPHLRARGGAVVQVASIAGQFPLPEEATYSASKFGLRAFSFALREELRGSGVRVSVVSPGPVDTGFIRDELDTVPDVVFTGPLSSPDEVAERIVRCALDGRRERTIPVSTGILARAGAAAPAVRRFLLPLLERQGARAKEAYRRRIGQ